MILAMIIIVALIYVNTLNAPFVFDDKPAITDNSDIRIRDLSAESLEGLITSHSSRPVANATFAFNYLYGGYNTTGYRYVNILIHIINGILFFFFLRITLNRLDNVEKEKFPTPDHMAMLAVFTSLIWIVNPLHSNSVTYIVQRMNSLAMMFYMISLLLYIKGRIIPGVPTSNGKNYFILSKRFLFFTASVISGCFAAGCKENAFMLPVCIFLYDWFFIKKHGPASSKSTLKLFAAGFTALISVFIGYFVFASYSGVTFTTTMNHLYALQDFTLTERILTQFRVVIYYICLIFYPHPSRLNLDYQYPVSTSLDHPLTTFLCLAAIVIMVFAAIRSARKERIISFAILWFFLNLIIESSFIPLALIYEHRTYIPSIMLTVIPVLFLFRNIRSKAILTRISILIILVFSVWTYQRNSLWKNDVTFWQDSVAKSPGRVRPLSNLGIATASAGFSDKAIELYRQSLNLKPSAEIHNNLGNALYQKGQIDEAIFHYKKALRLNPKYMNAHMNLGNTYAELEQIDKALYHYREVQKKSPDDITLLNNMGKALFKAGRLEKAKKQFNHVLRVDSENWSAYNSLGAIHARQKKFADAVSCYKKALSINPDSDFAQKNLEQLLRYTKMIETLRQELLQKIAHDPKNAQLLLELGRIDLKNGFYDQAAEQYQRALSVQPDLTDAIYQLALIDAIQGKPDAAVKKFKELITRQPDNPTIAYNIACLYSRMNDTDHAFFWLKKAILDGYDNNLKLKTDPDLDNIRKDPSFQELIK